MTKSYQGTWLIIANQIVEVPILRFLTAQNGDPSADPSHLAGHSSRVVFQMKKSRMLEGVDLVLKLACYTLVVSSTAIQCCCHNFLRSFASKSVSLSSDGFAICNLCRGRQ